EGSEEKAVEHWSRSEWVRAAGRRWYRLIIPSARWRASGIRDSLTVGSRLTGSETIMFDLPAVQAALRAAGFDGWLLYDFRGLNILAQRVAGVSPKLSRRWFYYVPAA